MWYLVFWLAWGSIIVEPITLTYDSYENCIAAAKELTQRQPNFNGSQYAVCTKK